MKPPKSVKAGYSLINPIHHSPPKRRHPIPARCNQLTAPGTRVMVMKSVIVLTPSKHVHVPDRLKQARFQRAEQMLRYRHDLRGFRATKSATVQTPNKAARVLVRLHHTRLQKVLQSPHHRHERWLFQVMAIGAVHLPRRNPRAKRQGEHLPDLPKAHPRQHQSHPPITTTGHVPPLQPRAKGNPKKADHHIARDVNNSTAKQSSINYTFP